MRPRFGRILIVGLGLIGGSLAAACRKAFPQTKIIGISRSRSALSKAKKKGWIHRGFQNLEAAFKNVGAGYPRPSKRMAGEATSPLHLVLLCTPVDTLKNFLKRLDRVVPRGTIVTDTGSVKGFLVRWADREDWRSIRFVGAHPMAGSHQRGIDAAGPHLFQGSLTLVTPGRRTSPRALGQVKNFWKQISHRVVVISPEAHDRITGEVSHLPHLVAALLVDNVSSPSLRFAASGFLDTTRVAEGDPSLWIPILVENRKELTRTLLDFEKKLKRIKASLARKDFQNLRRVLTQAQTRRRALE